MPRNGSGVFSVINPVLIGRLRSSSAVNANFTDMGTQITNSLPLDATAGMTGQGKLANGTTALPAVGFKADTNTGFKRRAADAMAWIAGAVERFYIDGDGKAWALGALDVAGDFSLGDRFTGKSNVGQIISNEGSGIALRDADDNTTYLESLVESVTFSTEIFSSSSGVLGDLRIPFGGTIAAYSIVADTSGNATVEIWKDAFANFPPTSADKITGTAPIALVAQSANAVTPISDWTSVTVTAGDVLRFNLVSIGGGIGRITITLAIARSFTA